MNTKLFNSFAQTKQTYKTCYGLYLPDLQLDIRLMVCVILTVL